MSNEELVLEYQNGNHQALDELIKQNEGLVHYFANKYLPICPSTVMDKDDLVQEGSLAIFEAAGKYKVVEKEVQVAKFSSYASMCIKGKMLRAINVSVAREKRSDIESPIISVNSIDALLPNSDSNALIDLIPCDDKTFTNHKDIEKRIDNDILRKDLLSMLDLVFGCEFKFDGINFNEVDNIQSLLEKIEDGITAKEVLFLHYGLFGKSMTLRNIGEAVGLSGMRIEQIESKGIYDIRKSRHGKEFMKKYETEFIDNLKEIRENMDAFDKPENVVNRIELIDELLKQYI